MTDTTQAFAASPRLERPREGGFFGVCAALARTTSSDLVLWRVLFVVLTFFAGLGVALYVAGIMFIPREGNARSVGHRLLLGPDRHLEGREVVLVAAFTITAGGLLFSRSGILILAVAAGLGYVWWRSRQDRPTGAASPQPRSEQTSSSGQAAPAFPPPEPPQVYPPAPPRPPVRRSPFVGLTVSLAILTAGVLALIGTGDTSVPAEVVLASALGVVGLGLVVGSFFGRSTLLVLLAVALGLGLAGTAGARPALDHGVGDRTWSPTASGSYVLGIGDATLDLSGLTVTELQTYRIDARVDVGHLLVLVPEGVRVSVDARAKIGDVVVFGQEDDGRGAHKAVEPDGRPQVVLDLSVRTGQVEVRRG
ncbi:MAG: hypothetical protein JWO12_1314 [Frankiales bacterium]|nr:hypothetical protein [Frankiales bacterium]